MFKDIKIDDICKITDVLNCIPIGVIITDSDGHIIHLNDQACKNNAVYPLDVLGSNVNKMKEDKYSFISTIKKSLETKDISFTTFDLEDDMKVFIYAQPIFKNKNVHYIVSTETDITKRYMYNEVLKENIIEIDHYKNEIEYFREVHFTNINSNIYVDINSKTILKKLRAVAELDCSIALYGEKGIPFAEYANYIYMISKRKGKPYISINCNATRNEEFVLKMFGSIDDTLENIFGSGRSGCLELANGGILHIEQIDCLPLRLQERLLNILERKKIVRLCDGEKIPLDIRVIVSTTGDLLKSVEDNTFSNDLFLLLTKSDIKIPPLRERKKDVAQLAKHYIQKINKKERADIKINESALSLLTLYDWPGNETELYNVIERSYIICNDETITESYIKRLLFF